MKKLDFIPDGILFDVDGTIWDSTGTVCEAWNKTLRDLGYEERVTADRLKGLFGLPMDDIVKDIVPYIGDEALKVFIENVNKNEHDMLIEKSGVPFEGIKETIEKLSKKFPVFIVSNCQSGYIELVKDHLKLGEYIKDQACFGDTGMKKAENIKLINDRYGLKHSVYVGDTIMDEEACRAAGEFFIFASYGFGKADGPDAVIEKASDLTVLLEC